MSKNKPTNIQELINYVHKLEDRIRDLEIFYWKNKYINPINTTDKIDKGEN